MTIIRSVVVGGHARGVGKTALVVDIIRAFPEAGWIAVKISPHGHGAWPQGAGAGQKKPAAPDVVLQEERDCSGRTSGSRALAAGARRAFWLRTREGCLLEGMRKLRPKLDGSEYVVFESNAVLDVVGPQLCLMVLDPAVQDFKESARKCLSCVDAFVARSPLGGEGRRQFPEEVPGSRPIFLQRLGEPLPEGLVLLIRNRLFAAVHPPTT